MLKEIFLVDNNRKPLYTQPLLKQPMVLSMEDQFSIYVEQLRDGRVRKIDEILDPVFLDIHEAELSCKASVHVVGEAYLADGDLILHLQSVKTTVMMPCSICNNFIAVPVEISNIYHTELLSSIRTGIYSFKEMLREELLLEVPQFAECGDACPMRKELASYLQSARSDADKQGIESYKPFADLRDLDVNMTYKKKKTKN